MPVSQTFSSIFSADTPWSPLSRRWFGPWWICCAEWFPRRESFHCSCLGKSSSESGCSPNPDTKLSWNAHLEYLLIFVNDPILSQLFLIIGLHCEWSADWCFILAQIHSSLSHLYVTLHFWFVCALLLLLLFLYKPCELTENCLEKDPKR